MVFVLGPHLQMLLHYCSFRGLYGMQGIKPWSGAWKASTLPTVLLLLFKAFWKGLYNQLYKATWVIPLWSLSPLFSGCILLSRTQIGTQMDTNAHSDWRHNFFLPSTFFFSHISDIKLFYFTFHFLPKSFLWEQIMKLEQFGWRLSWHFPFPVKNAISYWPKNHSSPYPGALAT